VRLYMVRHGETDWNKAKKVQGRADIPLNAYGRELAEKTAEGLRGILLIWRIRPFIQSKRNGTDCFAGEKDPLDRGTSDTGDLLW